MVKRLTWREFLFAIALIAGLGLVLAPGMAALKQDDLRASCAQNLRQLGVAFRMYADETPGGFYPPMAMYTTPQFGGGSMLVRDCSPEGARQDFPVAPDALTHLEHIVHSPNVSTIYPEYLTDFRLFVCPADPGWTTDDVYNAATGEIDLMHLCNDDGPGKRGAVMLAFSYLYTGWLFDKTGNEPFFLLRADQTFFTPAANGWPDDAVISAQLCAWTIQLFADSFTPPEFFNRQSRGNIEIRDGAMALCGGDSFLFGNGVRNTIHRLRKGAWRFLITDINNPQATSASESGIFVMNDRVSTVREEFNHYPDGGNVLYLDGHVEFVNFPGKAPIGRADSLWASLTGPSTPTPGSGPHATTGVNTQDPPKSGGGNP